jgi:hypothetical protein
LCRYWRCSVAFWRLHRSFALSGHNAKTLNSIVSICFVGASLPSLSPCGGLAGREGKGDSCLRHGRSPLDRPRTWLKRGRLCGTLARSGQGAGVWEDGHAALGAFSGNGLPRS